MDIATKSPTLATRLSRWELILEKIESLQEFERRGIPTITPTPSQLLVSARHDMAAAVVEGIEEELRAAESKSAVASTTATRLSPWAKVIAEIDRIRRRYAELRLDAQLAPLEEEARRRHQGIQVEGNLEVARKAEFMGQVKKALDGYREALYVLRHDDVADDEQAREITEIEERIASLGGAPKEPTRQRTVSPDVALKALADLREAGLVTDAEFEAKKAELLARL